MRRLLSLFPRAHKNHYKTEGFGDLKNICEGIQERYSIKFETIGFDEDHVHFMLQALPRFSPSRIFQIVKSISAIKLFENFPEIKKEL